MKALSRRDTLAALTSTAALAGCATGRLPLATAAPAGPAPTGDAEANAFLDQAANNLLRLQPETATSLGVDKGERAGLRSLLGDRSAAGQARIAATLRSDLAKAEGIETVALTHSTRTSVEVVRSAYRTALEGFALPYGDVAVGGWRNTPYVIIQNVGAYLDIPRFLDSEHQVKDAADAEALMSRLSQYPAVLDGELGRMRDARAKGLVPPAFLIDKALTQLNQSLAGARSGGSLVELVNTKTKAIPGDWEARARSIVTAQVAPALARQVAELQAERGQATNQAGMWARPGGAEYYRWALKASTTTTMSPDEVHQLGLDTLRQLQGRMDPILRQLGYTQGSVGARMKALADDPKYQFSEGDKGRAEIMAFIEERLRIIRAQMPRAFRTLTRGNLEVKRLPPEEEPGAPGAYGGPGSIDGSIPGKFWINLRTTDLHSKYSLPDLTHHEAIPGHVWQGEYAQKLPLIRSILAFNA